VGDDAVVFRSAVGNGCTIGAGALVDGCQLAPGTVVPPKTVLIQNVSQGTVEW
jgi:carbonic anhydrase/acetyltransferase-like protein (isoleucine patch superfamily)